jgi:pimeloyl-ACP methyl ester carboxylesterase
LSAPPAPVALHVRAMGAGEPVVILHGLLGSGRNWQGVGRELAGRWRVLLPDLRDHGRSPWSERIDYLAMAADLEALLDREGLPAAAFVGHSMGGKVAMTLALLRPERVHRLAVVDIAPVDYGGRGFLDYIAALKALDLATLARRALADAALAPMIADAAVRAFLLQNLEAKHGHLAWAANLDGLARAMPTITGFPTAEVAGRRYDGPALFLRGELSHYVLPEHWATIRALFPRYRLVTVRGAGHWVHADAPAVVTAALERFLEAEGG